MELAWRVVRRMWVVALAVAVLGVSGAACAGEGWLGVMLQPLSDEIGEAMNLEKGTTGVLVSDVVEGSPAEAAGFEKGDVIVEIDGAAISDVDGAIAKVKDLSPGSTVKMVVLREGKKDVLAAVLGDRADMAKMESKDDEAEADDEDFYGVRVPRFKRVFKDFDFKNLDFGQGGYIGVEIRDISADLGSYFGVGCCEGVLVLEVVEDSPAARAGLKAGDVIIKADGEEVHSSGWFAEYVRGREPGDKLDVIFKRSKETRRLTVEVGENDSARTFLNRLGEPCDMRMCRGAGEPGEKCKMMMGEGCMEKCRMMGDDGKRVCIVIKQDGDHECKAMMDDGCRQKCKIMMGEDCMEKCKAMMGEGCAEKCKMMMGEGPEGAQTKVMMKVREYPEKGMQAHEKAMECHGKAMKLEQREMTKCPGMMGDAEPTPDQAEGRVETRRPSPEQIRILRSTEGAEADLKAQIDEMKKEIEHLKQEMEALRKP